MRWIGARLRRRPPGFGALDTEGRLVALYGILAVLWVAIAANVAYRVWSDRVAGLVTGLWHGGWGARLLLVAVVAGLGVPETDRLLAGMEAEGLVERLPTGWRLTGRGRR